MDNGLVRGGQWAWVRRAAGKQTVVADNSKVTLNFTTLVSSTLANHPEIQLS